MVYKKQVVKNLVALLLFIALMLPTAIHFFHIFEGHEHNAVTEKSTQVHETISKCDICDFQLASFSYDIANYPDLLLPNNTVKIKINFNSLQLHSFKITNTQLRAPPVFS